uniref:Uncharacterized protein n=1 Tax=Oryza brachyantha TaxID=4533 RepID=J3MXU4_ORYBR
TGLVVLDYEHLCSSKPYTGLSKPLWMTVHYQHIRYGCSDNIGAKFSLEVYTKRTVHLCIKRLC